MTDDERAEWVANDEYLYLQAEAYPGGADAYVRDHRDEIDKLAAATMSGDRTPHSGPTGEYLQ